MHDALTLLPEIEVRRLLGSRRLALTIVKPPYPALGVGVLRVLRIRESEAVTQIAAGYDSYERL